MKRQWYVVVEYTDVFGAYFETEIPCASKAKADKTLIETKYRFSHDRLVSNVKIYAIYR